MRCKKKKKALTRASVILAESHLVLYWMLLNPHLQHCDLFAALQSYQLNPALDKLIGIFNATF